MLTTEEKRYFMEQGYVVTHIGLDATLRTRAIDKVWDLLPATFERNHPATWKGLIQDSCHLKDMEDRRGRVKFRECVRKEKWLYDLMPGHPDARAAAEALLGAGEVSAPRFFRGLYPVFPCDAKGERSEKGHLDTHPFQVGAVLYLDDVGQGGGGFHVWPGSHLPVALAHASLHEDDAGRNCAGVVSKWQRKHDPVECSGPAGTLILWHQRLIHAAGLNRTDKVRQAMLCDFSRTSLPSFQSLKPHGRLWQHWALG